MQKVITVTVTSGSGRKSGDKDSVDRFVSEHEFYKVNEALKEGYKIINVIQTSGSNTGNLHPTVIITFVLEK
ncbi:hypothetical protein ACILDS_08440 [Capnocytophaga canis]|uniref:hypothetical protein n=1 Tax=Capnocytophaga canis TaxID=1848903 RepID=UPI0037D69CE0